MPDTEIQTGKFAVQRLPSLAAPLLPLSTLDASLPMASCANCGTPLAGPYCAQCGQHVADFHRSVWRFVSDFFDNTICWDNKLLRTLEPLFKQPGFLTQEFMAGRRVRYVHPLRLFLFTSAVCLALLKYGHDTNHSGARSKSTYIPRKGVYFKIGDVSVPLSAPDPSPAAAGPAATVSSDASPSKPADKTAAAKTEAGADDDDDDAVGSAISHAVTANLGTMNKDEAARLQAAAEKMEKASSKFEGASKKMDGLATEKAEHLSWVALALLPLFALGLRMLYRREGRFYFEHLIFSLHYHVFLLLFWTSYVTVLAVASYLPLHGFFEFVVRLGLLLPPIYLYVALRRVYGEEKRRTVIKTVLLGATHLLAIIIGVAIGAPSVL